MPHTEFLPRDLANRYRSLRSGLTQPRPLSPSPPSNSNSSTESLAPSLSAPLSIEHLANSHPQVQEVQDIDRDIDDIISLIIQDMEAEVELELQLANEEPIAPVTHPLTARDKIITDTE